MFLDRADSQISSYHLRPRGSVRSRSTGATSVGNAVAVLYGRNPCHAGRNDMMSALSVPHDLPAMAEVVPPSFVADCSTDHYKDHDDTGESSRATTCASFRGNKGCILTASTLDALPGAESVCSDSCWSSSCSEVSESRAGDIERDFEDVEMNHDHHVFDTSEGSSGEEDIALPRKDSWFKGTAGRSKAKDASCWSSSSSGASEFGAGDSELDFEVMEMNRGHHIYETSESSSDDEDSADDVDVPRAPSNTKKVSFDFGAGTRAEDIDGTVTSIMLQHVPLECTELDLQLTFHSAGFTKPHISVKVFPQGPSRKFALVKLDSPRLAQHFWRTYQGALISRRGMDKPLVLLPVES